MQHYFNSRWVEKHEILIPGTDLAVTRAYAMFDYLRTYQQLPFHLDAHIARLFRTGEIIHLDPPHTREEIRDIVREGIRRNRGEAEELDIKIVVTGGHSDDGITPLAGRQNMYILFGPVKPHLEPYYHDGGKLITRPLSRILTAAKSSVYLSMIVYRAEARATGALEIINVRPDGVVTECMRSNIFFIIGDQVVTPTDDILRGVTRQVVIELLARAGTLVQVRTVHASEFPTVQGALTTGSGSELIPIVQIDDQVLGDGLVHPKVRDIMQIFTHYTESYTGEDMFEKCE